MFLFPESHGSRLRKVNEKMEKTSFTFHLVVNEPNNSWYESICCQATDENGGIWRGESVEG